MPKLPASVTDGKKYKTPSYTVPSVVDSGVDEGATPGTDKGYGAQSEAQSRVKILLDNAETFIDGTLSPIRAKAAKYYRGEPFGDEVKGRSAVVSTDVRDAVQEALPDLLDVFFSPEQVCAFDPRRPDQIAGAEQQTEYVNFVITNDNDGYMTLRDAFHDALLKKMGIVKWWYEETDISETVRYSNLPMAELEYLAKKEGVENIEIDAQRPQGTLDEMGQPVVLFDVSLTRQTKQKRVKIAAVPPEEFYFNQSARSLAEAELIAHVRPKMYKHELVAMGYTEDDLDGCADSGNDSGNNAEVQARNPMESTDTQEGTGSEEDDPTYRYAEAYVRLPVKSKSSEAGTIYQMHKVVCCGPAWKLLRKPEPVKERRPFALFIPDPTPHTLLGLSLADYTMDIQRIKSVIQRGTLDSLLLSLNPRMAVVEGQVNMKDAVNNEIASLIRVRMPGMLQEIAHQFVGQQALPVLQYFDGVRDKRVGFNETVALDPKAMTSTAATGIDATMQAAKKRLKMIARTLAETGLRDLYKGIAAATIEHQDQPRMVRLRGQFVEVDPSTWDADLDVKVNVSVNMVEEKLAGLSWIAQQQWQIITAMGPSNPVSSIAKYRNTIAKATKLMGWVQPDEFYNPVTDEQLMQQAAEAQKNQPPSPEAMLAQVEMQSAQMKAQLEQQKQASDIQLAQMKMALDQQTAAAKQAFEELKFEKQQDLERDKLDADIFFRAEELKAKFAHDTNVAEIQAQIQRERNDMDHEAKKIAITARGKAE